MSTSAESRPMPAPRLRAAPPSALHAGPPLVVAWALCCVSVTAMLLGSFAGSAGAYGFAALWLLLAAAWPRTAWRAIAARRGVWVFPLFALASVAWSQSHGDTLRFGMEYVLTCGCAILAASVLPPHRFISALTVSLMAIALLCLVAGKQSVDPLTGSSAFVGVFESKNQLGFFASLMLLCGLALLLDRRQELLIRALGLPALALAAPLLILTRSGTAVVTAALAAAILVGGLGFSRLHRFTRTRMLAALIICLLPLVAIAGLAGSAGFEAITGALGKDATLTGRTLLWHRAAALIPDHLMLGYGFQAFWRQNDVVAESLWHEFHVLSRQGFHFHNSFIEAAIELGITGAALLAVSLVGTLGGLLRWSWRTGGADSAFFVALLFCLIVRSFVEVDVLFQFQIGSFLLFVAASYAGAALEAGK